MKYSKNLISSIEKYESLLYLIKIYESSINPFNKKKVTPYFL